MEKKRAWSSKGFTALLWGTLAVCVVCIVTFFMYYADLVAQTASYMYSFVDYFMAFYQSNMPIVIVLAILLLILLFVKRKREVYARVFLWILLVLGLFLTSTAIQSMASRLPQLVAEYRLFYVCGYLPSICMAVTLVVLTARLDAASTTAIHRVSLLASIVAGATLVVYLVWVGNYAGDTGAFSTAQGLSSMLTLVCMTLVNVVAWYMTSSRHLFDQAVYAMTDVGATLMESVEDKVQAAMAQIEKEIFEGMSEDADCAEEGVARAPLTEEVGEKAAAEEGE